MLCPVCAEEQVIVEYEGVELDLCVEGHGIWFDDQELHMLLESVDSVGAAKSLESTFEAIPSPPGETPKRCPRCSTPMEHVRAPADPDPVILDRCRHGHGLWFDAGELRAVLAKHASTEDSPIARVYEHLSAFESGADHGAEE
ncbi:MAG: zf-TFIIB domain-containing protein [Planctomycetes bacterium]|nr:zf-TFIIB domain-containing protein [Planctomycetota bacterium]